ncbi:MAG TPA: lactonase family protein [Acetobacteraceae bacterium]|jgi:6-phosphogluconolactonase (cycloisomerase 2 family)|nr:lactonase family protein [Acetobacteraceae bacterium]
MPNSASITRRTLLVSSIVAAPAAALAQRRATPQRSSSVLAYVGSYTDASTPAGHGQGITLWRLDLGSGAMSLLKTFPAASPSWLAVDPLALDPLKRFVYAVNEIDTYGPDKTGSATAYTMDRLSGDLTALGTVSARGKGTTHGSVHPSGKFFFVANYGSGSFAVLPIQPNGTLGEAVDVAQDSGPPGAGRPAEGPPGNFSISDHNGPHAHMISSDPTGRFVIGNDLGLDRTYIWRIDLATGKLNPNDPPFIPTASEGAGPRHFAFHPKGRVFYNLYEEASQLAVYDWNPQTAAMTLKQKTPTLSGYSGTNFTSEIVVAPDGRFLYVANRLHNTIGVFAIAPDGRVRWIGEEWTRGDYPRNIALDPTGRFMAACNHRSDNVTIFRVDRATGMLAFTNQYAAVGSPSMIMFPG